jgi:protein tyrosine phosphatase (PTP) superfamily phosphohydrolase (DUF442 family)
MSVDQAYNFRKVSDKLSTSGVLSPDQLRALKSEGYEVVINLLPEDSEYAIEGEAAIVRGQGIVYEYVPVDFAAPTARDFQAFEKILAGLESKKVLLHCAANYRVSAFYSIYACLHQGWSVAQARDFMGTVWNLDEYPEWEKFVTEMLGSKSI